MSLPIFAYDNILTTATVTATSEQTLFPVSNLTNWKPSRWWKSDAFGTQYINIDAGELVDVDYFGVFSHDLEEKGATVKLQYGTKNQVIHSNKIGDIENNWGFFAGDNGDVECNTLDTTAPDGSNEATRVVFSTSENAYVQQSQAMVENNTYTLSVWLKAETAGTLCRIAIQETTTYSSPMFTMVTLTAEWERYNILGIWNTSITNARIVLGDRSSGKTIYLWGAQLEEGELGNYVPTTTEAAIGGFQDLTPSLQKSKSEVIFKTFTSVNKRYFRTEIDATTDICSLGVIGIGKYIEMQRGISKGFTPPHMNIKNRSLINVSNGGIPLGNSIVRKESLLSASFEMLTVGWVRDTWLPLIEHAELNPLFFSWNNEFYQDEAVFTMLDASKCKTTYKDYSHMGLKISGKAWHTL